VHHRASRPALGWRPKEDHPVEMAAGLILILLSVLIILFVIRTVQANLPR